MVECQFHGSGGHITAEVDEETAKRADLGVGKLFLAPIGKVEAGSIRSYHCKECDAGSDGPPEYRIEQADDEKVADGLTLAERGQYACKKGHVIGEYRVFKRTG
ncbi:conserved hypothetical protein [Nitrosopumilaceae archaeon]|nr:hypothetical protein [Nitrosopumilus sp.]CAI9831522.1 conserved hypothetical protein [Nitrosopumilaceae archaeon]MDA7944576.1 hypothetical protein [Nitrosopumilus sp.]MDA7953919.1 hypothetical protein [Nitrosopumilus sp.]MDA7973256.1 hypothetical protein [Nitrosopumilus sp.]